MMMPNRKFAANNSYRYGFNGKENDNEVKGEGNQQDYRMRMYDPRLGKFLSVDPLSSQYPFYSPYQYAGNKPIWAVDLDGAEELILPRYYIPIPKLQIPIPPVQPLPPIIPPTIKLPPGLSMPQSPTIPPKPISIEPIKQTISWENLPKVDDQIDWGAVEKSIDPKNSQTWPDPPFPGNWKEAEPKEGQKKWELAQKLGHKRLENPENGDVLRPHMPDKYHPKWHWDLKRGGNPNNEWENFTPDGVKIPKGSIYGKDFNPTVRILPVIKVHANWENIITEYNKKMEKYNEEREEYKIKLRQYIENLVEYQKEERKKEAIPKYPS